MKILEIHIYGYGKLENVILTNLKATQVFYGENEAGKSTIMSFIHSILFGFPTKQQSELRYEPKKGTKYGGHLILQLEKRGRVMVERVKGKATGDVNVVLEDGTTGGDGLLKALLSNIDKNLFQSIFSFNLHGLQNIHHLKSEDLGKFLFSTGSIGSDKLLTVENYLQKEMENRFKPNGKKPYINEKLMELKNLYTDLKRAEQKNAQYGKLLEQKELIEDEIEQGQFKINSLQKKIQQLEEWNKISPIVKERNLIQTQLENLKVPFPVDGLTRLDNLQQLLKPLEAQLKTLTERRQILSAEIEASQPNKKLLESEALIQRVLESLPLYETLQEEEREWQAKRSQYLSEIEATKDKLNLTISEEELNQINTSVFMKEKTLEAEKKQIRLKERKLELDEQFSKEKEELERLEYQVGLLEEDILPEEVRQEKQEKLLTGTNKDAIERELQSNQDKQHLLKMTHKKEKERAKQSQNQSLILSVVFFLLIGWSFVQSQWVLTVIGAIGLSLVLFLFFQGKNTNDKDIEQEINELKKHEEVLLNTLKNFWADEIRLIEEQLKRDSTLREQLTILKIKTEQQHAQYERVIQAFEIWEQDALEHEQLLQRLGGELSIPEEIAMNHLHAAFLLIEKLKESTREYKETLAQIEKRDLKKAKIQEEILTLCQLVPIENDLPLQEKAFILRNQLKKEQAKQQTYELKLEKYSDIKEQVENLTKESEHLRREQKSLFQMAEVFSEEEYRLAGKVAEKQEFQALKHEELSKQIALASIDDIQISEWENIDPQLEIERLHTTLNSLIEKNQERHQTLADIKHQIALIEEGGVYGELLHKFKLLQSELDIEAKEWAKLSLAKEILTKTINRFKDERLPTMLKQAEQYLSFLTDGNYIRMIPKSESNGFLIERNDHILFDANELSQATMEQVYVSLRLALATTIYKKYSFPIIMDDSFVNFDHIRTEKVLDLLKSIKNNQILFFTCHKHLLSYFEEDEVIELKEKREVPFNINM